MVKRSVRVLLLMALIALVLSGTAMAISMFTKEVAGLGKMTFTDEVTITDIKVSSLSKVKVWVESKANTQADHVYTVYLYLDDTKWPAGLQVVWAANQIPGVKQKLTFTGLDLSTVVEVDAEVWP